MRVRTRLLQPRAAGEDPVHDRQGRIPGFRQGALRGAKVLLIGAGGLGGEVGEGLARKGVGHLIYLDSDTIAVLREHEGSRLLRKMELGPAYEDNHLVFPGPLGRPLDPSVLTHTFERLTRQAGFKGIRLHDLRHFHATLFLREGVHPKVVQERLGHSTIVLTLDTYSHVVPGLQERAAQTFAEALKREARWKGDEGDVGNLSATG